MPRRKAWLIVGAIVAVLLTLAFAPPQRAAPPPSPAQPDTVVVDQIGWVSPEFAQGTSSWLHARESFEAVLYLDAVPPAGIDNKAGSLQAWTTQTAIEWGVGKARKDRGLAFFVFRDARLARIEVGYGLEGRLPDVWLRQMLEQELVPRFAQGKVEAGIEATLQALDKRLQAEAALLAASESAGLRPNTTISAWARTWADAWNHGSRLVPAVWRRYLQSSPGERLIIIAFVLPPLAFALITVAVGVGTVGTALKIPKWHRALRQRAAGVPVSDADLPPILQRTSPGAGLALAAAQLLFGLFVVGLCGAITVFVFSLAPDHLARQGQYGGGGVTVTWPAAPGSN